MPKGMKVGWFQDGKAQENATFETVGKSEKAKAELNHQGPKQASDEKDRRTHVRRVTERRKIDLLVTGGAAGQGSTSGGEKRSATSSGNKISGLE